ncbi:hypothetical protein [Shimia sp. SK013]|uniref:hypothetical protein n=1 Tax=Shimia sp. SK013 TaxID=1389006 RepID=UPI00128F0F25|nr:hypothetical protein [Shimia sp. SK013]
MRYVVVLCAALAAGPVWADENAPDVAPSAGTSLMEEGARLFFRGLQDEMAPALDGMRELAGQIGPKMQDFLMQMGPAMAGIVEQVEDWSSYHAPQMLENGDIILRKKTPEEMALPEDGAADGVEL